MPINVYVGILYAIQVYQMQHDENIKQGVFMKDYYVSKEMCDLLHINRKTLHIWKKNGNLPYDCWYQLGKGEIRYDKKKIHKWIEEKKNHE